MSDIRVKHISFGAGEIVGQEIQFSDGEVISIPKEVVEWLESSGLIEIKMGKGSLYSYFDSKYPNHVIIQKEGFFYAAHGRSADVLGDVMDYKIAQDKNGISITGGPDLSKIADRLIELQIPFIALLYGEIEEKYDG